MGKELVRKYLFTLDECKSLGPDGLHPSRCDLGPLNEISGAWGKLPEDRERADVVPIFKRRKK